MDTQIAIKQLKKMHDILKKKFKKTKDLTDFKNLQEFLQFIVFDDEKNEIDNKNNPFAKFANQALKDELRKSPYVQNLYKNFSFGVTTATKLGEYGEQGFSFLLAQAINILEKNGEIEKDENLKNTIEKIIIGKEEATMMPKKVLKKISDEVRLQGQSNIKTFRGLFKKYGVFALKQGKIDIDMARFQFNVNQNQLAKKLSSLAVTVKNYSKDIIHLENVNVLKAYQACHYAITRQRNVKEINKEYDEIFLPILKEYEVLHHMTHIVNLYALTGMGQSYIDKVNLSMVQTKLGADTLAVSQRKSKKIYIIPTADIAALSLDTVEVGPNVDSGFRYGKEGRLTVPELKNNKQIDVSLDVYQAHKQIFKNLTGE